MTSPMIALRTWPLKRKPVNPVRTVSCPPDTVGPPLYHISFAVYHTCIDPMDTEYISGNEKTRGQRLEVTKIDDTTGRIPNMMNPGLRILAVLTRDGILLSARFS